MSKLNEFRKLMAGDPKEALHERAMRFSNWLAINGFAVLQLWEESQGMCQRLQTLPWFRSDGGEDAYHCLNHQVWKDWNYGECERLMNAVQEIKHADD